MDRSLYNRPLFRQSDEGAGGSAGGDAPRWRTTFHDSEQLATVFRAWGMDVVQLDREQGDHWVASAKLEDLRVWTSCMTGRYRVRTGVPAGTVLVQISPGSHRARCIGGVDLEDDDILTGFAKVELTGVLTRQRHGTSFVVPDGIVATALAARAPGSEKMMQRTAPYILSRCGSRVAALRQLVEAALSLEDERARQLAAAEILDVLLGTLLLPWHREADATFHAPTFQRLPTVRRVEDFMRSRLGDRLMLHDLCRAARASQRSLEYAFSSIYDMGPKQYLKILRLNAVNHVLRSQPPEAERISEIAERHGFWHMGHFAADYHRLFGETPQQTRARRGR